MGKPIFSGTIMKVLGLKGWEDRMRVYADQKNGRNLGYSPYPELYNRWQNLPQYQHQCRNHYPMLPDSPLHHLSADDGHRAWLHHHDMARRYEEKQLAQMHGRHPRRRPHPQRRRRHHDTDEDYEDEYDGGDTDEGSEVDGYTDGASSMSYERTRHGHHGRHRPRSHGGPRLNGRHPLHHGIPPHGGWHGTGYGGYPEGGPYEDEYYFE